MSGMLFYSLLQYYQLSGTPSPGSAKESNNVSAKKLLKYKWRVQSERLFLWKPSTSFTHIYAACETNDFVIGVIKSHLNKFCWSCLRFLYGFWGSQILDMKTHGNFDFFLKILRFQGRILLAVLIFDKALIIDKAFSVSEGSRSVLTMLMQGGQYLRT